MRLEISQKSKAEKGHRQKNETTTYLSERKQPQQIEDGCLQWRRNCSLLWLPRSRRGSRFLLSVTSFPSSFSRLFLLLFKLFCWNIAETKTVAFWWVVRWAWCRYGSGLRYGEERGGGCIDGRDETGAGDEIHRARCDGWCVGYLWFDHCGYHQYRDQPQGQILLPLWRLRPPLFRSRLWPRWPLRRHGHRHRRRCRR